MTDLTVSAAKLGPIESIEFELEGPGVTVLYAPNGYGKSLLGEAVNSALAGSGKIQCSDNADRGALSAFGATVTFGSRTRHGGRLQVLSLAGKVDIAALVDPSVKDPAAADKARIRQLLLITQPEVSSTPFRESGVFPDFSAVVGDALSGASDMVEMGERIKKCYEAASRDATARAAEANALVQSLQQTIDSTDMLCESDESVLLQQYDTAKDNLRTLEAKAAAASAAANRIQSATEKLSELEADYSGLTVEQAVSNLSKASEDLESASTEVQRLAAELRAAQNRLVSAESAVRVAESEHKAAVQQKRQIEACRSILARAEGETLDDAEYDTLLTEARNAVAEAAEAINKGAACREAKAAKERKDAAVLQVIADSAAAKKYRSAAQCLDAVFSDILKCDKLLVRKGRLYAVGHPRGEHALFHELSHGERYRIILELVVRLAGRGAVVYLSQEGWEALDAFVRAEVDKLAEQLGVHVFTLEATPKQSMGRDAVIKRFVPE